MNLRVAVVSKVKCHEACSRSESESEQGVQLPAADAKPNKKPLIYHRMPEFRPSVDNFHLIDLDPGSRIAKALGSNRAVVNSSHSVRTLKPGIGLKVTARAPDGVIEALEHEDLPVMAFQFHPERMTYDARFIKLLRVSLSPIAP